MRDKKWPQGKFSWGRPVKSYAKYHRLYTLIARNRRFQLSKFRGTGPAYLHVGCGSYFLAGFINIDYIWQPGVDLCWDITRRLPFHDDSVQGIFCEHCLEHFPFVVGVQILQEFFRILRPDGTLRLVLPDAEIYADLYQRSKQVPGKVSFPNEDYLRNPDIGFFTPMMAVNRVFRDFGHRYAYDSETLRKMLSSVGYSCALKSYNDGTDGKLLVDQSWHAPESLYVEAYKTCSSQNRVDDLGR